MRTKVAVSSVIDGGRKLIEVEVEVEEGIVVVVDHYSMGNKSEILLTYSIPISYNEINNVIVFVREKK